MAENYYQILGVSPQTTEKEIRRVYHQLASKFHPDKARSPEENREFELRFAQLSEAYNVLKDAERRREYDKQLGLKDQEATLRVQEEIPPVTEHETPGPENIQTGKYGLRTQTDLANVARRAFRKGQQFFQAGDAARAVEFFEVAVKNVPQDARYLTYLALALVRSHKDLTRAIELCKKAMELEPFNMDHRMRLGEVYETMGSLTLAKKTYEDVIRWDNTMIAAHERLQALEGKKKKPTSFVMDLLHRFMKRKYY